MTIERARSSGSAPVRAALRWLSRSVYGEWMPAPGEALARAGERYLEDLWRDAPWPVALGATGAAAVISVLPVALIGTLRLFHSLSRADKDRLALRLLTARAYPLRLLGHAAQAGALVATLRDPAARAVLLGARDEGGHEPEAPLSHSTADAPRSASRRRPDAVEADYLIVGSGAAGATAAVVLGEQARDTVVLEEGGWYRKGDFTEDLYGAMATLFRDFGAQFARGRSLVPVLEGCCVGGTTVLNGAIAHRLPKTIYELWSRDEAFAKAVPFDALEEHASRIEADLGIVANLAPMLPRLPAAAVLRGLGWAHHAMRRSAPGCQASGRCLQGCPSGGKLSMEASYLPRAMRAGVRLLDRHRVLRLAREGRAVVGAVVEDAHGRRYLARARKAVILAAGTLQSPVLLRASGIDNPHVGRHFQCHLSVSATALLDRPVRSVEGPPQGIEVLEFDGRGIKLATQLVPAELVLARAALAGSVLARLLRDRERLSSWMGSIRAEAEGTVSVGRGGRPSLRFSPTPGDMERVRYALERLGELLFALGAVRVFPGVLGLPRELTAAGDVDRIRSASLDPRAWHLGAGHLFGTCRMGGDPGKSVVGPDFRVHGADRLYVVDASVFPTNVGVNPQLAIMTLARHAAYGILERSG